MDTYTQTPPVETTPVEKAKKPIYKRWWAIALAAVFAIVVLVQATSGGSDTPAPAADMPAADAPAQAAAPKPAAPKPAAKPKAAASQINKPVRDGKFEFTVKNVKCGISKVGNEYLSTKAQGQFCAVQLTIANIGDEPQSMFSDNQKAFDAKGREFSADSEAAMYDDSSQVLWEEINPGNSVKGKVYFDLPKGAKITQLELHDSMLSDGVKVVL